VAREGGQVRKPEWASWAPYSTSWIPWGFCDRDVRGTSSMATLRPARLRWFQNGSRLTFSPAKVGCNSYVPGLSCCKEWLPCLPGFTPVYHVGHVDPTKRPGVLSVKPIKPLDDRLWIVGRVWSFPHCWNKSRDPASIPRSTTFWFFSTVLFFVGQLSSCQGMSRQRFRRN
jgi:hypothetical protein